MYYPYLRGKQFDLLALKEAINRQLLSPLIIPIIEPVRDSATLKATIELFQKVQHPMYIIENPQVGQYKFYSEFLHPWTLTDDTSIKKAQIITPITLPKIMEQPPEMIIFDRQHKIAHRDTWGKLAKLPTLYVMPDDSRFRSQLSENKIILSDTFHIRKYAENYAEKTDDFFSDNYLFYEVDGYQGFGDFTIESSQYFDKGFPSRALVLHITYIDAYGNLRIKHFVSDTNDSAKDQAQKFYEALEKLKQWTYRNQDQLLITEGILELLACYESKKFPGLGVLKKWTLLHHLELLSVLSEHPTRWLNYSKVEQLPLNRKEV
ncbi:MAG: sce7725 family protein [Enterococcus sp.]